MGRHPLRNLAPADITIDSHGSELPVTLGLRLGSGQVAFDWPGSFAIVGELVFTGKRSGGALNSHGISDHWLIKAPRTLDFS